MRQGPLFTGICPVRKRPFAEIRYNQFSALRKKRNSIAGLRIDFKERRNQFYARRRDLRFHTVCDQSGNRAANSGQENGGSEEPPLPELDKIAFRRPVCLSCSRDQPVRHRITKMSQARVPGMARGEGRKPKGSLRRRTSSSGVGLM